ncbi:hypothetical protein [Candidatus Ichthyocystis hellenicum]|uniref:hypothetical protein n=1 Tax=Candidatus Ichthyocystis hellenicum TaxID=1561003 RepID=UPI0011126635|nr:hypothetical protein [Candidatus Ichthyocystis hellenicum]
MKILLNKGVTDASVDIIIKDVPIPISEIAAKLMLSPKFFTQSVETDVSKAEITIKATDVTIVTAEMFRKKFNVSHPSVDLIFSKVSFWVICIDEYFLWLLAAYKDRCLSSLVLGLTVEPEQFLDLSSSISLETPLLRVDIARFIESSTDNEDNTNALSLSIEFEQSDGCFGTPVTGDIGYYPPSSYSARVITLTIIQYLYIL